MHSWKQLSKAGCTASNFLFWDLHESKYYVSCIFHERCAQLMSWGYGWVQVKKTWKQYVFASFLHRWILVSGWNGLVGANTATLFTFNCRIHCYLRRCIQVNYSLWWRIASTGKLLLGLLPAKSVITALQGQFFQHQCWLWSIQRNKKKVIYWSRYKTTTDFRGITYLSSDPQKGPTWRFGKLSKVQQAPVKVNQCCLSRTRRE